MERCIFCGSTRKSSHNLRFFGVPKEPGLKRIQWLYVLGDRDIGQKDRVCAIHFRQGKPSNDPSHEDFVPHLNLNEVATERTLEYLESLDTTEDVEMQNSKRSTKPTILQKRKTNDKKICETQSNVDSILNDSAVGQSMLISIPPSLYERINIESGQEVVIKQYKIVKRRNLQSSLL